jgi:ketosteroid isomerase-like protein
MSEENLDLVRQFYADFEFPSVSTEQIDQVFRDSLDEDFELRLPSDYPEGEPVFRGRDGFDQLIAWLRDTWDQWRIEPERFLDAGDLVVVFGRIVARGGASGAPIALETTHVWTIHSGRAMSVHAYRDRAEALEAAGVRE